MKEAGARDVITLDGYKYMIDDRNWIMIRLSGTEAVVRVYTEGSGDKEVKDLQELGKRVISSVL